MIIPLRTLAPEPGRHSCPHFPAEGTGAQRSEESSPGTHSKEALELGHQTQYLLEFKVVLRKEKKAI